MRVWVGRAGEAGERTAARLAEAGHDALLGPLFEIVTLPLPRSGPPHDALVITSARAAPAAAALHRAGPAFAVGDGTAAALREAGLAEIRSAAGDGRDLARLVAATLPAEARLLLLAGRDRRPEPEASLVAAGFAVTVIEVYAAEPVAALPEPVRAALVAGELDAALHYSPRAAATAKALAEAAGLGAAFGRLHHACLSAAVAAPLRPLVSASLVAARPAEDSLLAALDGVVPLAPPREAVLRRNQIVPRAFAGRPTVTGHP